MNLSLTKLIVIVFMIILLSCRDDSLNQVEPFVPCDKHADDIVVKYFDNVLDQEELQQFINGRWRLHRFEGLRNDSVLVALSSVELELRFMGNTLEVYEPYDTLLGSSEYIFDGYNSRAGELFRLEQVTSIAGSYYLFGTVIPCNSEMVFYLSDIDSNDRFYRKVN